MQNGFIKLDNLITEILHFPLNFQNQNIKFPNNQQLDDKKNTILKLDLMFFN